MKVQKTKCNQCLFTKNKIVSGDRARSIVKEALQNDTFFGCHKTQLKGLKSDVCCKGFWDSHKNNFKLGRLAQWAGAVQEVVID